ncbi:MAG: acetate--CoA ligase family protein [Rhodospirillaceae bacterium]|jgi:acyl-CoA synthetase (NDP forming)
MTIQETISQARKSGRKALDESNGKQLLAEFGVTVPQSIVTKDAATAAGDVSNLKFPVVVKVMSADILHKSDAGGVKVGLQNADEVSQAIAEMAKQPEIKKADVDGYLVEEMAPPGQELVVGGLKDPQFGPLVMVGLGGIFVEVLKDVAFRICPIEEIDAREMLAELKGAPLLKGARGQKPVSEDAIIDVLMKVGGDNGLLMQLEDDIAEADINPLIVSDNGAVAVDARFILTKQSNS